MSLPPELRSWHGQEIDAWRRRWGVPDLRIFQRIGSTNDLAAELAEHGAARGTLVLADEQTRGRGRRGRAWTAPAGTSLSMSMVLRPPTPESSRLLTLRLGIAAARALEHVAPVPVTLQLKWPNDLELQGRKLGGILCEASTLDDRIAFVVAGIGINLRTPDDGWPPGLAGRATSLAEATSHGPGSHGPGADGPGADGPGPEASRARHRSRAVASPPAVVGELVRRWLEVAERPAASLTADEVAAFDARDSLRGREVAVDGRAAGVASGVAPDGSLRVDSEGHVQEVSAGTVRALEPTPGGRT